MLTPVTTTLWPAVPKPPPNTPRLELADANPEPASPGDATTDVAIS